jgi:hypothetical protein
MHENGQFLMVAPRGTPRNNSEHTNLRPPSAIGMVADSQTLPTDTTTTVVDTNAQSSAHGMSFAHCRMPRR